MMRPLQTRLACLLQLGALGALGRRSFLETPHSSLPASKKPKNEISKKSSSSIIFRKTTASTTAPAELPDDLQRADPNTFTWARDDGGRPQAILTARGQGDHAPAGRLAAPPPPNFLADRRMLAGGPERKQRNAYYPPAHGWTTSPSSEAWTTPPVFPPVASPLKRNFAFVAQSAPSEEDVDADPNAFTWVRDGSGQPRPVLVLRSDGTYGGAGGPVRRSTNGGGAPPIGGGGAPKKPRIRRLPVVGDSGVGKSSLVKRFAWGHAPQLYKWNNDGPTVGVDFFTKSVLVPTRASGDSRDEDDNNPNEVKLQIWDLAGQERFEDLLPAYYRHGDAVMLVYDVGNRSSFQHLKSYWMPQVRQWAKDSLFASNRNFLLVGLVREARDREVSRAEVNALAAELSAEMGGGNINDDGEVPREEQEEDVKAVEASVSTGEGVEEAFLRLAEF